MKKIFFATLALVICIAPGRLKAQGNNDCPGWRNPTSFSTGNPQYKYYGKELTSVPDHDGVIGVGPNYYTSASEISAGSLASTMCSQGCSGLHLTDGQNRFVIKASGNDPNTNNALPFLPPYDDNEGHPFNHSIRIGTECTYGAEVLYYEMYVKPENALLTIWYAPVVQTPTSHDQYENSAFIIRVSEKSATGNSWNLADPNLTYTVSGQPQTTQFPQGLVNGVNGWHMINNGGYSDIWYKDWTKAMISLDRFLYKTIRVEIYMAACVYDAHYAYSYIAGDYQPMEVTSSGCPAGTSTVVDTLRAPKDMQSYRWYKTTTGYDATGNVLKLKYLDSTNNGIIRTTLATSSGTDTIRWTPVTATSTNRQYLVQAGDFTPTEGEQRNQTVGVQTFMCKMISYLDPAKPFASYVYLPVENNKPQLSIDTILSCYGTTQLLNTSVSPNRGLDASKTRWAVYDNSACTGTPIQSLYGDTVSFTSPHAGSYYAKLWACTEDDSTCNTEGVFQIRTLEVPQSRIGVFPSDEPCLGDAITLIDSTYVGANSSTQYSGWKRFWQIDGQTEEGSAGNERASISHSFTERDSVILINRNGLHYIDRDNASNTVWCSDTVQRVIKVFTSPNLTVSDDTIVCKGNQTHVTVTADISGNLDYAWYENLNRAGESAISQGNVLTVTPPDNADTKRYYVKVTRQPQGCVAWDSITVRIIKPTIHSSREIICQGDTVTLWGDDAHHYSWSAGPGDASLIPQSEEQMVVVSPQVTTTYTLVGHGSDDCDAAPLTKVIQVLPYPIPMVSTSPSFIDSEEPTVTFTDLSPNHASSVWTTCGLTYNGSETSITFSDLSLDSVPITLTTANALGCSNDTTFLLPVQRFATWFPNAFTPNRMENSVFRLYTVNQLEYFSIYIYNRAGQLVFQSNDPNFIWDGSVNGEKCPQGVYTYICRYRRPGTIDITVRKGALTLLR